PHKPFTGPSPNTCQIADFLAIFPPSPENQETRRATGSLFHLQNGRIPQHTVRPFPTPVSLADRGHPPYLFSQAINTPLSTDLSNLRNFIGCKHIERVQKTNKQTPRPQLR